MGFIAAGLGGLGSLAGSAAGAVGGAAGALGSAAGALGKGALAIAPTAMSVGGTVMQTVSGLQEGKAAAQQGKYAQLMYERQAKAVEAQGLDEIRRLHEEGRRLTSRQIVTIAAGGGTLSGTSLKAIMNSAANVEADAAIIARNATFEAATLRYQGQTARYEGRMARYASRIRAATTLGKNVGPLAMMASKYGLGGGGKTTTLALGKSGNVGSLQGRNLPKTYSSLQKTRPWAGLNTYSTLYSGGYANA